MSDLNYTLLSAIGVIQSIVNAETGEILYLISDEAERWKSAVEVGHGIRFYQTLDEIGGKVRQVESLKTGAILYGKQKARGGRHSQEGSPSAGFPLSTVHISPHVEYRRGGNVLKTVKEQVKPDSKNDEYRKKVCAKRGAIQTFSHSSRRRLLQTLNGVNRDASLPLFATITYPKNYPSAKQAKKDLHNLLRRFMRQFPNGCIVWKLEPQERLAPHFHFEVWGVQEQEFYEWIVENWHEIAGQEDINHKLFMQGLLKDSERCVSKCEDYQHMTRYVSKYIAKLFEADEWCEQWTGRYWGVVNKEKMPLGELVQVEMSDKKISDVMRYQKRFAGIKKSFSHKTLTTFCNAEQWISNIIRTSDNG